MFLFVALAIVVCCLMLSLERCALFIVCCRMLRVVSCCLVRVDC